MQPLNYKKKPVDSPKELGLTTTVKNIPFSATSNNRPIHPLSSEYKKLSTDTAIAP